VRFLHSSALKRPIFPVDVNNVSTLSVPEFLAISELTQRAAELEVRLDICESERRHARITLESVPTPLIITSPFDDIVLVSDSAARLFGIAREAVLGKTIDAIIEGTDLHDVIRDLRETQVRGSRQTVHRMLPLAAGPRMFELTLLCVADCDDGDPSPWGVVVLFAPEPCILTAELTEPLQLIRSYAELLNSRAGDDPVARRRYAEAITAETSRLLAGLTVN
jgi:PAS domain-containing protein